jgi:hypothetical protein
MRLIALAACVLAGGLAGPVPVARAEGKPTPFSVTCTHAGLAEITLKDGKLHYVWHTTRHWDDGKLLALGCLENYDRHQIDVWLIDKETERFRDWVARYRVFDFEKHYPSASGGSARGAAYQSALTVVRGEKKHSVSWLGDSKVPKALGAAISELNALADAVQKSRNRSVLAE